MKRGERHMQPLIFEHYSSNDHNGFLEYSSITLIDKTDERKRGTLERNTGEEERDTGEGF